MAYFQDFPGLLKTF